MPEVKQKLNENELKVLTFVVNVVEEDYATYFRYIAQNTGLEVKLVRRVCRALARKGLMAYVRGLFDNDGMVAGSGYSATRAAHLLINPCKSCPAVANMTTGECMTCFQKNRKNYE
ncbi:MAG TPA: hypothetical protein VF679_01035 [Pedobacter sp.]|jgi:hypothetical protein